MENIDKILKELEGMQNVIKGSFVDKRAFGSFVQSLAEIWHRLRSSVEEKLTATTDDLYAKMEEYKGALSNDLATSRTELSTVKRDIKTVTADIRSEIGLLRAHIQAISDSMPEEYDPSSLQAQIETVKKSIPKIVTLQEVWDKFDKIEKKLRAIEDTKPSVIQQVFGGGRPVHVPMVDDWSTLTDGSTKQFYLTKAPRSLNTIKIWGSDFPYILRSGVDFTIAGKLVTLTSEVDAPSSGATLICEYYI